MPATTRTTRVKPQPGSAAALLAAVRAEREVEQAAAARQLALAADWADLHPPESIHHAAGFSFGSMGGEREEPIAGPGTPLLAEFCVAELGTVLGVSSVAAKRLIGNALELRHRLPRLWAQVHAGAVPAWRARLVAEATSHSTPELTIEAAKWIDAQVAAVAGKVSAGQLERLVAEAIVRHGLEVPLRPSQDPEDDRYDPETRHVTIDTEQVHYDGTLHLEGRLDLADALDLDNTLSQRAAVAKALGSPESLDARRARALGDLARVQTSLDLAGLIGHDTSTWDGEAKEAAGTCGTAGASGAGDVAGPAFQEAKDVKLPAARQLVLHIHLAASATNDGHLVFDPLGQMEQGQRLLLLDQVKAWCGNSHTMVVLKPVIDLNAPLSANGYAIPDRLREHVTLRDRTCVFPHCTRPARRCQVDHIEPYDHDAEAEGRPQPGRTETPNLAALCTFHHRLKTHTGWHYVMVAPGVFEWTSPHGYRYRCDHHGTTPMGESGFGTGLRPCSTSGDAPPSSTNGADPRH